MLPHHSFHYHIQTMMCVRCEKKMYAKYVMMMCVRCDSCVKKMYANYGIRETHANYAMYAQISHQMMDGSLIHQLTVPLIPFPCWYRFSHVPSLQ